MTETSPVQRTLTPVQDVTMRRRPVQARSTARVNRMLDAAASLIEEIGYEELTTSLVATRAGVSIGSLYQFFPDKRALAQELYRRYVTRFLSELQNFFEQNSAATWDETVHLLVDAWVNIAREAPAVQRVGDAIDRHMFDPERENDEVVADRLLEVFGARFGIEKNDRSRVGILMAVTCGDEMIRLSFRRSPHSDPVVIAEAKRMLTGYLSTYFDRA